MVTVASSALCLLLPGLASSQITPDQAAQIQNAIGDRVEALTILGGDFGLAGGTFRTRGTFQTGQTSDTTLTVSKLGGSGDIGDIKPIGGIDVGWQARVQGNLGFLDSKNLLHTSQLEGDMSELKIRAIEFGVGARFWLSDRFSIAPTLMGLYGRTTNAYTANSAFMKANFDRAVQTGLINWSVDTWTVAPAVNFQYLIPWRRVIFTLSSDTTYFHTQDFSSPSPFVKVNGDSVTFVNKIDADVPLGWQVWGHELRAGGYFSRTDLFGDIKSGLDMQHLNEVHGRLVLDFLNQLWKVQWLGIGVSYIYGTNINGFTGGLDAAFRF
jgi:hypothetical protein